jgi:hypothetical protein
MRGQHAVLAVIIDIDEALIPDSISKLLQSRGSTVRSRTESASVSTAVAHACRRTPPDRASDTRRLDNRLRGTPISAKANVTLAALRLRRIEVLSSQN